MKTRTRLPAEAMVALRALEARSALRSGVPLRADEIDHGPAPPVPLAAEAARRGKVLVASVPDHDRFRPGDEVRRLGHEDLRDVRDLLLDVAPVRPDEARE